MLRDCQNCRFSRSSIGMHKTGCSGETRSSCLHIAHHELESISITVDIIVGVTITIIIIVVVIVIIVVVIIIIITTIMNNIIMMHAGAQFDAVMGLEIIEHVDQPQQFLKTLGSLTKSDGALFISTINRTPRGYALAILGAEHLTGVIPKGTHDWNKFLTPGKTTVCMTIFRVYPKHKILNHYVLSLSSKPHQL